MFSSISFLGSTTPATMLAAAGSATGAMWDSYYPFFAFAAGLVIAFILIEFALSLIKQARRTSSRR